ncbi:MAG TPA: monovalent cation/H+ antiporter subunit D family protein, partial [Desulfobulbus sp.]|nr:monovalent cation/H+ antiporter subunit D family protein [Desulfobulbus sp.]
MEHTFTSIIPLLAAFTPMVAALLIPLLRKDPDKREAVSILASVITFLLVLSMVP